MPEALDLFSAACGGWSLGLHRAGFRTIAACEAVDWRRILYAQNNPGVPIYDDVRTLTADRLLADLGRLPDIVVGSPPCQDISSANTKGRGVEGERSGLYFEAIRLIGEIRPRWFALENSANLRTRGADAVLSALEALDYACWPLVVRASDVGANHERPRSWIIGCDLAQVADTDGHGRAAGWGRRGQRGNLSVSDDPRDSDQQSGAARVSPAPRERQGDAGSGQFRPDAECGGSCPFHAKHPTRFGHEGWRSWRHRPDGNGAAPVARCGAGDGPARSTPDPDQARQAEIADDGRGGRWGHDKPRAGQMAVRAPDRGGASTGEPLWSLADLAGRILLDDGLPARLAGARIAVGGPRGTSAASLIVEAYGDAVVPQIPEAIGRAILRVEAALADIAA